MPSHKAVPQGVVSDHGPRSTAIRELSLSSVRLRFGFSGGRLTKFSTLSTHSVSNEDHAQATSPDAHGLLQGTVLPLVPIPYITPLSPKGAAPSCLYHLSDCSTCSAVRQPAAAKLSTAASPITARSPAACKTAFSAVCQRSAVPTVRMSTSPRSVWTVSSAGMAPNITRPGATPVIVRRLGGAEPQPSHARLLPSDFLPQLISTVSPTVKWK